MKFAKSCGYHLKKWKKSLKITWIKIIRFHNKTLNTLYTKIPSIIQLLYTHTHARKHEHIHTHIMYICIIYYSGRVRTWKKQNVFSIITSRQIYIINRAARWSYTRRTDNDRAKWKIDRAFRTQALLWREKGRK